MERYNQKIISFLKEKEYIMLNDNLGNGSFGKTVLLKDPIIEELFVAKKYQPTEQLKSDLKSKFFKNFCSEIKILHKINHKNIVRIYNYYIYAEQQGYIIMEYIDGITIDIFMQEYSQDENKSTSLDKVFLQLIDAFCYLEQLEVIHRDIREKNIMIDKNGEVKVIDFGIGKINCEYSEINEFDSCKYLINRPTLLPEEYKNEIYNIKTDMFFLGELLYRLIHLNNLENFFSHMDILNKMMNVDPNKRFNNFNEIKQETKEKSFVVFQKSNESKVIYQGFVNILYDSITCFIGQKKLYQESEIFLENLSELIHKSIFEDKINVDLLIRTISPSKIEYIKSEIDSKIINKFYEWYKSFNTNEQQLILDNINYKLSTINVIFDDDFLPY